MLKISFFFFFCLDNFSRELFFYLIFTLNMQMSNISCGTEVGVNICKGNVIAESGGK